MAPRSIKTDEHESSPLLVKDLEISGSPEVLRYRYNGGRRRLTRSALLKLVLAVAAICLAAIVLLQSNAPQLMLPPQQVHIAFVGNSMFYFNDFPRFFQGIASGRERTIRQNSCLHGGGSIPSLVERGNAMYPQFGTDKAYIEELDGHPIYDYGACTVRQLLDGEDPALDDPAFTAPDTSSEINKNPCRQDPFYLEFAKEDFADNWRVHWDYVVINDNTRDPARGKSRKNSLATLESFYVPWFQQSGATPVFLWTQAYTVESTTDRNMTGLDDVANFTSLTYAGLKEYSKLLEENLPEHQKPRIAPVGLGFLMVHEERPDLWPGLFHSDRVHASPSGTFLQGCIVYYTLFGKMPNPKLLITEKMESLWDSARMMQHAWEPANPFPSVETASYLFDVAERIMVKGEKTKVLY